MKLSKNNDCISSGKSSILLSSRVYTERHLASFGFTLMIVTMTTGDLSNMVRRVLMFISPPIPATFEASQDFHTFAALILPLKVLSYPKNNHHALFVTYSTKAQQCVTSEKRHKTAKMTEMSH